MVDLERRQLQRLQVMNAIFEAADGRQDVLVSLEPIRLVLNLSDEEIGDVCKYLEGEYLIHDSLYAMGQWAPLEVELSHLGVKEMEASLGQPDRPTEHFPPLSVIQHFYGDVVGSVVQTASPGATQSIGSITIDLGTVRDFVSRWEALKEDLDLEPGDAAEAEAEIATLDAQVQSPKPKHAVIRGSVRVLQELLTATGGGVAATELLNLAHHILASGI